MNEKINLGIVIPTLNSERFLEHTLISLKVLISAGAQVLIVDSDSTDQTLQIAERHGVEVINEPAGNMYRAINRGIESLDNRWVTYINSDDLLYSDSIINALAHLGPSVDLIYGNIDYIDETGRYLHGWRSPRVQLLSRSLTISNPFPQQGTLFRREVWRGLSGFDVGYKYVSDRDFFTRLFLGGYRCGKYTGNRMAAFRLHGAQFSQTFKGAMRAESELMLSRWDLSDAPRVFKPFEMLYMRFYNLDSYMLRAMRLFQCRGVFRISKSIES